MWDIYELVFFAESSRRAMFELLIRDRIGPDGIVTRMQAAEDIPAEVVRYTGGCRSITDNRCDYSFGDLWLMTAEYIPLVDSFDGSNELGFCRG